LSARIVAVTRVLDGELSESGLCATSSREVTWVHQGPGSWHPRQNVLEGSTSPASPLGAAAVPEGMRGDHEARQGLLVRQHPPLWFLVCCASPVAGARGPCLEVHGDEGGVTPGGPDGPSSGRSDSDRPHRRRCCASRQSACTEKIALSSPVRVLGLRRDVSCHRAALPTE